MQSSISHNGVSLEPSNTLHEHAVSSKSTRFRVFSVPFHYKTVVMSPSSTGAL